MTTHWALDNHDATRTACNVPVGYLLTETDDDVTTRLDTVDCKDCQEEKKKT